MAVSYKKPADDDVPWDQRLSNYGQNTNAGMDEYKRALGVARSKKALGDTAGYDAANKWAGQVDTAIGGIGSRPGSDTREALQTYKTNLGKPQAQWSFDPNNNQAYQSALQAAQRSAQTAGNNATVRLGSRGVGNSQQALTTENQIQQRSVADVNSNMLPNIMSQDYARFRDQQNAEMAQNDNLLKYANAVNGLDQQEADNQYRTGQAAEQKKQSNIDLAKWGQSVYGFGAPKEDAGVFFDQYAGAKSLPVQQFEYGQSQDKLANVRADKQLDNDTRSTNATIANMSADNVRQASAEARQIGDKALSLKLDVWEKTGVAPAGIPGVQEGTPLAGKTSTSGNFNLDDYKGFINQSFYKETPDPKGGFGTVKQFDSSGARKYIIGLGLPDSQTDQILKLYGIPTN